MSCIASLDMAKVALFSTQPVASYSTDKGITLHLVLEVH